jgi:lactate dehydrogenase-like 2-hydroxyacid dehydrogenase
MKPILVVLLDPVVPDQLLFLQGVAAPLGIELKAPQEDDEGALKEYLSAADAVVVQHKPFTRPLMDAAPKIKMIQKMGSRRDGIDIDAARERNIAVALMSLPGAVAVTEHAFALILALAKKIIPAHQWTITGAYRSLGLEPSLTTERSHRFQWMKMNDMIVELRGLTLGIIGFGEIGHEITKRDRAFEMQVFYHNRSRLKPDLEMELGIHYVAKDELLHGTDFVSH